MIGMSDPLLTVTEVHKRLSEIEPVGLSTVYMWISTGQLSAASKRGVRWNSIRIHESALTDFIRRRQMSDPQNDRKQQT